MEKVLLAGIEEFPNSKYIAYMKKTLSTHYVKEANGFFTKGVGVLNSRVDGNRDQWDAIKAKAKVDLDKAVEIAKKALELNPKNTAAQTILTKVPELLKS